MKNLFILFALSISIFTISSCGNGDGDGGVTTGICTVDRYTEEVQAAVMTLSEAVNAYALDQSTANCEAYRRAAEGYLEAVKTFETCADIASRADFRESLREAEEEVANLQC